MANKSKIIIDGDNKGALSAISGVVNSITGLNTNLGALPASLTSAMKNPTLIIGSAVTALSAMVIKSMETADEFSKMSQKTGIATEALSTLGYAADLSDVSMETLQGSMNKLNKALYEANDSGTEQAKTFKRLGVDIKDASGQMLPADEVLYSLADKFSKMPDGVAKSAQAMQVFGKAGTEMIPLLNSGADGLREMRDEARVLGLEISSNTGKNAEAFNDNMTRLKKVSEGFGLTLMAEVSPALDQVSNSMVAFAKQGSAVKDLSGGIGAAFKIVATAAYGLVGAVSTAGTFLGTFGASAAKLVTGQFQQAADIWNMGDTKIANIIESSKNAITELWNDAGASAAAGSVNGAESAALASSAALEQAKKLQQQWEAQALTIQNELNKQGLNPYQQKLMDINLETNKLLETYKSIQGAEQMILLYKEMQIAKVLELNSIQAKPLEKGGLTGVNELSQIASVAKPQLDITVSAFDEFFNATNEQSIALRQNLTDSFGYMGQAAGSFYQKSGEEATAWFEIQKGLNIAEAVMNTYTGASAALKLGPIIGPIMAGSMIAAGFAMVAQISSTRPGRSAGGGAGAVNIPTPAIRDNDSGSGRSGGQAVTINVYSSYIHDADRFSRELAPTLHRAFNELGLNN